MFYHRLIARDRIESEKERKGQIRLYPLDRHILLPVGYITHNDIVSIAMFFETLGVGVYACGWFLAVDVLLVRDLGCWWSFL